MPPDTKAHGEKIEPMKAEVEAMEKVSKNDAAVKAWFEATYAPKMMGALGPIMGIAQTCGNDAKFQEAMKSLDFGK